MGARVQSRAAASARAPWSAQLVYARYMRFCRGAPDPDWHYFVRLSERRLKAHVCVEM